MDSFAHVLLLEILRCTDPYSFGFLVCVQVRRTMFSQTKYKQCVGKVTCSSAFQPTDLPLASHFLFCESTVFLLD